MWKVLREVVNPVKGAIKRQYPDTDHQLEPEVALAKAIFYFPKGKQDRGNDENGKGVKQKHPQPADGFAVIRIDYAVFKIQAVINGDAQSEKDRNGRI